MTMWPDEYPAQCPPADAEPSNDTFFRLVDNEQVLEQDFWSHKQRVAAGLERPRNNTDPCLAVGVSLFDSETGAANVRDAFGALRRKKIASGSPSSSGVVRQTGKDASHHTWWRPSGDCAWQGFVVTS